MQLRLDVEDGLRLEVIPEVAFLSRSDLSRAAEGVAARHGTVDEMLIDRLIQETEYPPQRAGGVPVQLSIRYERHVPVREEFWRPYVEVVDPRLQTQLRVPDE